VQEAAVTDDITDVDLSPLRVATRRVEGPQAMTVQLVTAAFAELNTALRQQGVEPVGHPIQVVHHGDEERFEHEACMPIAPDATVRPGIVVRDLDAGPAAVIRASGALDQAPLMVHSMMGWIRRRGHEPVMPFRVALLAMPPLFSAPEFADASESVFEIACPYR
jgi:DNA gyrase inhibitor GyrI